MAVLSALYDLSVRLKVIHVFQMLGFLFTAITEEYVNQEIDKYHIFGMQSTVWAPV